MFVGTDRRITSVFSFLTLLLLSQIPGHFRPTAMALCLIVPQEVKQGASKSDSLSGRVTSDSGHPIVGARVTIRQVGAATSTTATHVTKTERNGRFKIEALPNGSYFVSASLPGYFVKRESADSPNVRIYRSGESANIVLVKGGVVTGTISTVTATPLAAINVRAIKVSDPDSRPVAQTFSMERQSDDRGIYRIYGLEPGNYIVVAGIDTERSINHYRNQVPTYYPSETRSAAREIRVEPGVENNGIDIIVRNELAHNISGIILAHLTKTVAVAASVGLFDSATGLSVYETSLLLDKDSKGFAIRGVRDGEYELLVRCYSCLPGSFSVKRVKVEGADITNLSVSLESVGSASGRIEVEPPSPEANSLGCQGVDEHALGTSEVKGELDMTKESEPTLLLPKSVTSKANSGGDFALISLRRGRYRITVKPDNDYLYLKSAVFLSKSAKSTLNTVSRERPRDLANDGLLVKPGDEISDIVLTLAYGAASVKGKVISDAGRRSFGVHLYLVPAEPKYADTISLYAETSVNGDGTFLLANIIPGRYFVVAYDLDQTPFTSPRDVIWDATRRVELRRMAAGGKISVTLRPCERVSELTVPY
jgi:hypothetical protein